MHKLDVSRYLDPCHSFKVNKVTEPKIKHVQAVYKHFKLPVANAHDQVGVLAGSERVLRKFVSGGSREKVAAVRVGQSDFEGVEIETATR